MSRRRQPTPEDGVGNELKKRTTLTRRALKGSRAPEAAGSGDAGSRHGPRRAWGASLGSRPWRLGGRVRGLGCTLAGIVAATLSTRASSSGSEWRAWTAVSGEQRVEVTDGRLVEAICPAPVWDESSQKREYPALEGVLFGRVESGALNNGSGAVWHPLNASCNCTHNESLPANASQQTLHTTHAAFFAWIGPSRDNATGNATTNVSAVQLNTTAEHADSGAGAPAAEYTNVTCADRDQAKRWCQELSKLRNLTNSEKLVCIEYIGLNTITTVVVSTQIVVINNVTQVVQIAGGNSSSILEREINAFLSSFTSTGLLYDSNVGIGQFANIVLWIGFFVFCLFSIVLEWISARKRRGKMPISMLTLQSALTTLGYLTMAFGHGRLQTQQVFFKPERNMKPETLQRKP